VETEIFVRNFDRFFDMLNTRCLEEEIYKIKPDLRAYKECNDERFKVHKIQYLGTSITWVVWWVIIVQHMH